MQNFLIEISNIINQFDILSKVKPLIEDKWIKEKKIKESSLDLVDFIQNLNMQENIFIVDESIVIPYKDFTFNNNRYIFYCNVENIKSEHLQSLCNVLDKINNNQLKMINKTNIELLTEGVSHPHFPYFIINGNIKEIKQID